MRKFIDRYYRLLNVLLGISVGLLIIPVTLQMVSRFTQLIPAWIWTEEMARFLFIWMVMLGAIIGVRDASHFDVDVWPDLKIFIDGPPPGSDIPAHREIGTGSVV